MNQTLPKSFEELIRTHEKPVIVDFWAEWCAPCRMLSPVLAELAAEWKGRATVIKVNTDEKPDLARQYGIQGIPTVILFKSGAEVHRFSGAMPLAQIKEAFEPHLS